VTLNERIGTMAWRNRLLRCHRGGRPTRPGDRSGRRPSYIPVFPEFMNEALDLYKDEEKVISIHG